MVRSKLRMQRDAHQPAFAARLDVWHRELQPDGRLVLADLLPPDLDAIADVKALLAFAWRGGFLVAALAGLGRTFFSDYRRLRIVARRVGP